MSFFTGRQVAAALCYRVLRHTTISFSNIVGPDEEVAFYGHPLTYIAPSVFGHPQVSSTSIEDYCFVGTILKQQLCLTCTHIRSILGSCCARYHKFAMWTGCYTTLSELHEQGKGGSGCG